MWPVGFPVEAGEADCLVRGTAGGEVGVVLVWALLVEVVLLGEVALWERGVEQRGEGAPYGGDPLELAGKFPFVRLRARTVARCETV